MSDLTVHSALLDDLRKTFTTITGRMHDVQRTLRNADATAVGEPKLVDDIHDFADDWSYGITQIGKHTDGTVKLIDQVGKTFDDVDIKLANALSGPGGK